VFFVSDEAKVAGAVREYFAQNSNFTLFSMSNGAIFEEIQWVRIKGGLFNGISRAGMLTLFFDSVFN